MNETNIRRLLGLVEKTGDKVIVTDPAGEHPYVLMTLDQYERLVGGQPAPVVSEKAKITEETPVVAKPVTAPSKPQAPAWRSKLGLDAVEPPVQDLFKAPAKAKMPAMVATEATFETEGEEQFYLEPLE